LPEIQSAEPQKPAIREHSRGFHRDFFAGLSRPIGA
jgi:hypothetical protein